MKAFRSVLSGDMFQSHLRFNHRNLLNSSGIIYSKSMLNVWKTYFFLYKSAKLHVQVKQLNLQSRNFWDYDSFQTWSWGFLENFEFFERIKVWILLPIGGFPPEDSLVFSHCLSYYWLSKSSVFCNILFQPLLSLLLCEKFSQKAYADFIYCFVLIEKMIIEFLCGSMFFGKFSWWLWVDWFPMLQASERH